MATASRERKPTGETSAAALHDGMVAANVVQHDRLAGPAEDAWAGCAGNFQADPRRPLDALLTKIASYVQADDTVIDVGGGAGRLSLPLALRCREVVIVDPSPSMAEAFRGTVEQSGITNARLLQSGWLDTNGIEGGVALVAHVTYFVPEIVPFIEKLQASIRRRAIVCVRSVPPPNQIAGAFALAHGEELARVPGHNELLAVLNELGIAAELIDVGPASASATAVTAKTREDAVRIEIEWGKRAGWLGKADPDRLADQLAQHFEELFAETSDGYIRRCVLDARDLLITWETAA
jgi:2-polyprenyl-3-methyl-5-hydroxy-6-metoxy-1,4-benzoquinol methylase